MFISPSTLKTIAFITSGNSGLLVNHSAFVQASTTLFAFLFFFDNSITSCLALNINKVLLSPSAAIDPTSSSSSNSINDSTLYPPSIVPNNSVACFLSISGELAFPFAISVRKAAFT